MTDDATTERSATHPEVEIVVAALDEGINTAIDQLVPSVPDTAVLIVHQFTDDEFRWTGRLPERVRYVARAETGLSRSRNAGLAAAQCNIAVIADDDAIYLPGAAERIAEAYRRHTEADAITFRTDADTRWPDDFTHSWHTIRQVFSLVITYRPDRLRALGVQFDERFGLGATYPQGEDNILLADIRRAGGVVMAAPERIIRDPGSTSGDLFTAERITAKVVVAKRMHGRIAGVATAAWFAWNKRSRWRAQGVTPLGYVRSAWRGINTPMPAGPEQTST